MIKKLFMRIFFRGYDDYSLSTISYFIFRYQLISFLCTASILLPFIFNLLPLFIISICENELLAVTQILLYSICILLTVGYLIFFKLFSVEIACFVEIMTEKIYFLCCTNNGKVISKENFRSMEKEWKDLYYLISQQKCSGFCYATCFNICKFLKRGSIEFLAIKAYHHKEKCKDKKDVENEYTLHAIFVIGDYAFDPYSVRQLPVTKLHEVWKAKVYRFFTFDQISDIDYDYFRWQYENEVAAWCKDNDCYQHFKRTHDN